MPTLTISEKDDGRHFAPPAPPAPDTTTTFNLVSPALPTERQQQSQEQQIMVVEQQDKEQYNIRRSGFHGFCRCNSSDHIRGWASSIFFLLGGILYTCLSIVYVVGDYEYSAEEEDGDNVDDKIDWTYLIVAAVAALCYVIDDLMDISRLICPELPAIRTTASTNDVDDSYRQYPLLLSSPPSFQSHQLHNHQTKRIQWSLAITFGVAALLDLLSTITEECVTDTRVSNVTGRAAVHIYLLNAVLLLGGKAPNDDRLEDLGDGFFALGSIVDVLASYFYDDYRIYAWSNLVSSVLWLIDAILYILVDCNAANRGNGNDGDDCSSADMDGMRSVNSLRSVEKL